VANREEIVIAAGFDGKKLEAGAKQSFGTLDREASKASASLNRFALSGDGVLKKLAAQFSVTAIAAGAVFSAVAKSQQVFRDSIKAYENYSRAISVAGDGVTTFSESMDAANRAIAENNAKIGAALSPIAELGKRFEQAASGGIVKFIDNLTQLGALIDRNPGLQLAFKLAGVAGGPLGLSVGAFGGAAQMLSANGGTAGAAGAGFSRYGPDLPQDFYTSQLREQEAATKKATEDAMRSAERLFDNLVRQTMPNRGAIGGGATGFDISGPFGIGGPVSVPQPVQRTGPEFNEEALKAYEEAQRRSQEFREQFAANIGSGLSSAILESQNFAQAIGNIFKQTFAKILSDAGGSLFSSLLGGGPIGIFASLSTGRTAPGVTPATQSMARTLAPAMRREASVGRGF
jgi:hypothetical protein